MQFSIFAVLSFAAMVIAAPTQLAGRSANTKCVAYTDKSVVRQVSIEAPAMTDANGNIIPFNSAGVVKSESNMMPCLERNANETHQVVKQASVDVGLNV